MADSATHRGDSGSAHAPRARRRDTLSSGGHMQMSVACKAAERFIYLFFFLKKEIVKK